VDGLWKTLRHTTIALSERLNFQELVSFHSESTSSPGYTTWQQDSYSTGTIVAVSTATAVENGVISFTTRDMSYVDDRKNSQLSQRLRRVTKRMRTEEKMQIDRASVQKSVLPI
jgi:hypothetical protein